MTIINSFGTNTLHDTRVKLTEMAKEISKKFSMANAYVVYIRRNAEQNSLMMSNGKEIPEMALTNGRHFTVKRKSKIEADLALANT